MSTPQHGCGVVQPGFPGSGFVDRLILSKPESTERANAFAQTALLATSFGGRIIMRCRH